MYNLMTTVLQILNINGKCDQNRWSLNIEEKANVLIFIGAFECVFPAGRGGGVERTLYST